MMKALVISAIILTIAFLAINTFIWLVAQGTGHIIPLKTNLSFVFFEGFLILLLIVFLKISKKGRS
jgi:hypothetical protein